MRERRDERELTPRQRKWLSVFMQTGNATEAAMQAYDCANRHSARQIGYTTRKALCGRLNDAMDEAGLSDAVLLKTLKEGLEAVEVVTASHEGQIQDERAFPDFVARHRYLDMAFRLKGSYPAEKRQLAGPDGGPVQVTTTALIAAARATGFREEDGQQ